MKIRMLLMSLWLLSCNQSKKESADNTATGPATNTAPGASPDASPYTITTDPAFLGEWVQQYSVADANNNALLDDDERTGKDLHLGFDYFRFNEDLTCLRDHDMKLKGSFEISNASGKNKLIVRSDPPGENYTYMLAGYTASELRLFTDGVFIIFKRP
jgi:hypothetical protein